MEKLHTHASVLKACGFALLSKETGPNPGNPKQTSTLKSFWKHTEPVMGNITIDHMAHTFDHDDFGEWKPGPKSAYSSQIGKSNKLLIQYLDSLQGEKDSNADMEYCSDDTPVAEKPVLQLQADEFLKNSIAKLNAAAYKDPIKNKPLLIMKPGTLVDKKAADPIPLGLDSAYTHKEWGHTYTWSYVKKAFASSQGKIIDAKKMKWMLTNSIVAPKKKEEEKKAEIDSLIATIAKEKKPKAKAASFDTDHSILDVLFANGYSFISLGAKTGFPKYKESTGKTVYSTSPLGWQYFPMGSSSMNPYGSSEGEGAIKLDEVLKAPFEKPEPAYQNDHHSSSNFNKETKKFFTPHVPELEEVEYKPLGHEMKELEDGFTVGGDSEAHVELLPGVEFTKEETAAISSYKGSGSSSIQEHALALAKDDSQHGTHKLTKWVLAIDSAIKKGRLNKDVILFRGVHGTYAELCVQSFKPGDTVHEAKAFIGCSSHQNVSHKNFAGSDKLVFRIRVPKGTPALCVSHVTTSYKSEHEILLSRHGKLQVTGLFASGGKIYSDMLYAGEEDTTVKIDVGSEAVEV